MQINPDISDQFMARKQQSNVKPTLNFNAILDKKLSKSPVLYDHVSAAHRAHNHNALIQKKKRKGRTTAAQDDESEMALYQSMKQLIKKLIAMERLFLNL